MDTSHPERKPDPPDLSEPVLGPLGVDDAAERVYRHLLRAPGASATVLGKHTGLSAKAVNRTLGDLVDLGLVTRAGDRTGRYVALRPNVVVGSLAARRKAEIERAATLGAELGHLLEGMKAEPSVVELITIVEGHRAMAQHCRRLQETAEKEVLAFERPPYATSLTDVSNSPELEALERGISYRVIYESTALEVDGALQLLGAQVTAGEKARVHNSLPVWLLIADARVALVPLSVSEHSEGGAVLIHSSWLLDALTTLFEALWKDAVPLPDVLDDPVHPEEETSPLSERDRMILTMLAAGIKDEAIAARLGYNPATVRRRINKMARMLGVETRFQAGLMAGRKGWL